MPIASVVRGHFTKKNMMRNFTILLTLIFVCSCNNTKKQTMQTIQPESSTFKTFLQKFKPIDLPFIYRDSYSLTLVDINNLPKLDSNSSDTLFLKSEFPDETYCYGILTDTANFYSLIYLFPADALYPVLVTYTKTGKLIDKTYLSVNGCGSDAGLTYCSSTSIINKDLTVFCADTVKYDFICDSVGKEIPNSSEILIDTKKGRLTKNGKIIMGQIHNSKQKTTP